MRAHGLLPLAIVATALAGVAGCATNAATFYEGTRFAFAVEYNPASGQPGNLTLGYKRRIAAIVPPQARAGEATSADPSPIHKGEALSLVSLFDVGPGGPQVGSGIIIRSAFASGMAARDLTETPRASENNMGLFAGTTLPLLSPAAQARRDALIRALTGKVDNESAARILQVAGLRVPPPDCPREQEALCTLQSALTHADEATLQRLEGAATQVIFAPVR
jgi:hypothetical protein